MKNHQPYSIIVAFLSVIIFGCQKNEFSENKTTTLKHTGKTYYVSANGSNNNIGTRNLPFATLDKAASLTQPGDSVYLMSGTYNISSTIAINNSGTATAYIVYKAFPGNTPKFVVSGAIYDAIVVNGSYVKIDGIEMQGNNPNLTLSGAQAAYNAAIATTPSLSGTYNTNAITIGGANTSSKFPHHVEIKNCSIHDFPAAGISAIQADYVTIENNVVFNNSWYTIYATSGITILSPFDSDNSTGYKNIVRGNTCYGNKTLVNWISTKAPSDGNGIIIDVNTKPYSGTGPAYNGRTLVENNVSYFNGGSGIHAFSAGHVDIRNNTAYANGQVVGYADIYAASSNDVNIVNNIMYSRIGGKCNTNNNNTGVTYDYNVYYNGTIVVSGTHDKVSDPLFINASTNPLVANFQLSAGSPAVNAGSASFFAPKDILGVTRPKGGAPDCGAYESF